MEAMMAEHEANLASPVTVGTQFERVSGHNVVAGQHVSGGTVNNYFQGDNAVPARPLHSIPFPRNEDVVDRPALFTALDRLLPPSAATYQSAALWGLGGSGKTQIALEYAYRRCRDAACVLWVHADDETTFAQAYKQMARQLSVPEGLDGDALLIAVCNRIEALGPYLLVLDNADDLRLFGVGQEAGSDGAINTSAAPARSLSRFVPNGVGTVLWTSRDKRISGSLVGARRGIQVGRMADVEARLLLESVRDKDIENDEADDTERLLDELERLPLAVTQAAAYLRRTSTSIRDYLAKLFAGQKRWELLQKTEYDRHRRPEVSNSILETWNISVDHMRTQNPVTYNVLLVLAFIDHRAISDGILRKAVDYIRDSPGDLANPSPKHDHDPDHDPDQDHVADENDDVFLEMRARLQEFSFLSRDASTGLVTYEMHKLVQEALRYRLSRVNSREDQRRFAKVAFHIVNTLFPESHRKCWDQCEMYLVHAQRAGEYAEAWGGQYETSKLLCRVSRYLFDRGRWTEKESVNWRTLILRREVLGDEHPDTLTAMGNLALAYNGQGRWNEAEALNTQVIDVKKRVLGEEHPDTLTAMGNLALAYDGQGRWTEAEKLYIRLLQAKERVLGEEYPGTLITMGNLALAYISQGRWTEAEALNIQVIEAKKRVLGEEHHDTLIAIGNLASAYDSQGRWTEAEALNIQVIEAMTRVLGEEHPNTLTAMGSLALAYNGQGRWNEAEALNTQVIDARQRVLGDEHPDTLTSMYNLAMIWKGQGRDADGLALMQKCAQARERVLGSAHPHTLSSLARIEEWNSSELA